MILFSSVQSHYIKVAQVAFLKKRYEIWADFGPVGNTEKKIGADYEQLFSCFQSQKKYFLKKYSSICTKR